MPLLPEKNQLYFFVTFILSVAFLLLNFVKNCRENSWFKYNNFQSWALPIKFRYSDSYRTERNLSNKKGLFSLFLFVFFSEIFAVLSFFREFSRQYCVWNLFFFFNYLLELRALLHFRVFFYENYGTKDVYDNDDNEKYWHKNSKINIREGIHNDDKCKAIIQRRQREILA